MKLTWIPGLALAGALAVSVPALAAHAEVDVSASASDDIAPEKLKVGSTVPAKLALTDFDGNSVSFEDLRGKVVLLHFWSSRCPAEKHANPVFKQMEARYAKSKDVVMIGIAANQNELGAKPGEGDDFTGFYTELRDQRDKVGLEHTILADHGNRVSGMFQARTTPHCYVIDGKGVVRYSGALDDDPRGKKGEEATNYLVQSATAILAGEKLPVTETKPYG